MSSQKESSENIQWLVRYRNSAILLREIQYKGCPKGYKIIFLGITIDSGVKLWADLRDLGPGE
eukprot:scaffold115142_cov17-Tisochrysis_lutea.AAC.1